MIDLRERVPSDQQIRHDVIGAVARNRQVTGLRTRLESRPDIVERDVDRLVPEGDHLHRVEDLGLVGHEPVLLNQVTGQLPEPIGLPIAAERWSQDHPEPGVSVGGGIGVPVPKADVDHVAKVQVEEVVVGEVGRCEQDREDP
ncbi:hypothetical protein D3C87_1523090 [compost metagenome]